MVFLLFLSNHAMISSMDSSRERILLVENDPDISDVIAHQTLEILGYEVQVARAAAPAIQEAGSFSPDLVITNLELPGLSGKDLLVALSSQGLDIPVIVLAQKGREADLIQAFRLGAADYLIWPAREAEVVSAVERVINQVRTRRERETLARQVKQTNEELQRRVRELTTIFNVGKAITSVTKAQHLFDKIIEAALYVSEADCGWLLLREERANSSKTFIFSAQRNLPPALASRLYQPWEDGISSLVALSGETLSIHGEPLGRFKVSQLGQSALIAPIKVKKEVIGLIVTMRKKAQPFSISNKALLEAVSDYASIALSNARMFLTQEERAQALQHAVDAAQAGERLKEEALKNACQELSPLLKGAIASIDSLLVGENARLNATQKGVLRSAADKLQEAFSQLNSLETTSAKA